MRNDNENFRHETSLPAFQLSRDAFVVEPCTQKNGKAGKVAFSFFLSLPGMDGYLWLCADFSLSRRARRRTRSSVAAASFQAWSLERKDEALLSSFRCVPLPGAACHRRPPSTALSPTPPVLFFYLLCGFFCCLTSRTGKRRVRRYPLFHRSCVRKCLSYLRGL